MGTTVLSSGTTGPFLHNGAGDHAVQFYADDKFLIEALVRFVGGPLAAGDAAVVAATSAHLESLERGLRTRGIDLGKIAYQGRYVRLDAEQILPKLLRKGMPDESLFSQVVGSIVGRAQDAAGSEGRVVVFGEMVWLLMAQGKPQAALRLEQLWNDLSHANAFSLLCAYPISGFSKQQLTEAFLQICGQHSTVLPSESYTLLSNEDERLRTIAHLQQQANLLREEQALRRREERFRCLVEAIQDDAIVMLDTEGRVTSWSAGAERIKGYTAAEIIGRHFSCFYALEVRSSKPQMDLEIAAREGRFEDEGWRLRKDGSRYWANLTITAIRDRDGRLTGFGEVTRDCTERIRDQEELLAANRELAREIGERKDAERRLHTSEQSLRQLSRSLLQSQDEERRRIGRDLHDSLGQYLAVMKMKLDLITSLSARNSAEAGEQVAQCTQLAEDAMKELRTISYLLYPPMLEELGLTAAISWYMDGFASRSGIEISFDAEPGMGRLPRDVELAMFRVLQECLTNVHRHSGSQTAQVRLSGRDGMAILEIRDQGKGVTRLASEPEGADWLGMLGVGLRGMNERVRQLGGRLELTSTAEGTTVSAIVPAGGSAPVGATSA
jgi:PAS domain S-box-containing protein